MPVTPDTLMRQMYEGTYAETALALFVDVNEAAASSIIERACSAIDNEKLDPTTAVALWHEIRAYRRIKERLAQKVRQGARAAVAVPDTVEKVGGPAPE